MRSGIASIILIIVGIGSALAHTINDRPTIVRLTKYEIDNLVKSICTDPQSMNYGGFPRGKEFPYACSRSSIHSGQYLIVGYIYPDFPEYYNSPEMLERIKMNLDFMKRRQRENGSIALGTKSVDGSNEVGFTLPGMVETYKRVQQSNVDGKAEILGALELYIKKGAQCIRENFPYTSNHRWAACTGPLAMAHSLFPNPNNEAFINDYLIDGIDIDDKGMYYEECSPNYNSVANWGLSELADYWGKTDYLKLIALNLEYQLAMRQPNNEAETLFSHRQDRGEAHKSWGNYYMYKRLAIETNNGVFANVADQKLKEAVNHKHLPKGSIPLLYRFDDEKLQNDIVTRQAIPENYEIRFDKNPIWRYRTKDVGVTVVADKGGHWWDITQSSWGGLQRSDVFMSYHFQNAIIDAMRIRWVGGNQSFHPENIEYLSNGSMRLVYVDPGSDHVAHFRPTEKWGPRHIKGRNQCEVIISHEGEKFKLEASVTGWEGVHANIQLLLREDCTLISPKGKKEKLQCGGETFTTMAGDYILEGPQGHQIKISGILASQHDSELEDNQYIETEADRHCHKLVMGLFTPVKTTIEFEPIKKEN